MIDRFIHILHYRQTPPPAPPPLNGRIALESLYKYKKDNLELNFKDTKISRLIDYFWGK